MATDAGRVHTAHERGGAVVSVIATWPEGAEVGDIEEAVKQAARDAIRRTRTATGAHQ